MKDCLRLKRKQILQKLREHMRIFSIFEEWVCTTEIIKRNCEKPWRRKMGWSKDPGPSADGEVPHYWRV